MTGLYRLRVVVFVGGVVLTPTVVRAEKELSPAEQVGRANVALAAGHYEQALEGYRQAEVLMPEAPELAYNQGVAYYRMKDYAKAREQFSKGLATRDLNLETKIKFNLGNCQYAEALEKLSNLQEAIDKLRSAIEYYVDVLGMTPDDGDTRANIETAQLLIKDLLDKLKKQQEEQQKDPTSQSCENPQQPQQQGQQDQQQQKQEGEQQQQQQEQQQGQQEQQQQEQQSAEQQQAQEEQKTGEEDEQKLTQEEAQRLLQSVRDKEQKRRDEQTRRRQLGRQKVEKDW